MADPKLIVQILAELGGLTKSLKAGEGQLDQWADKAASVGKALTAVAVGAGLAALGKQIFDVTAATARQAEVTEQLSQMTGIAAQTFERWSVPLARVGLTGQDVARGMQQLSRNILQARDGSGEAAQAFARLGVDLSTIGDSESAIKAIADQFQALPDGIEKAALAQQVFGLSGARLIPILNQGSAGIEAMTKQSEAFGLVLSQAQRTSLTQFDDALDDLSLAARGLGTQIGAAFAPALDWMTRVATVAMQLSTQAFQALVVAATTLTARFVGLARATAEIASTLFSSNALSLEAWRTTVDRVKAIDQETAATIAAIRAGDQLVQVTTKEVTVTDAAGAAQERLGLKIRDAALAMLQQSAAAGKAQEALGAFIVTQTQAQVALRDAEQEGLGRAIVANEQAAQQSAQAWIESYVAQQDAALARVDVDLAAQDKAQEALGQFVTTQAIAASQVKGFWQQQLEALVASNAFSIGQIVSTWTSGVANMIVKGGEFKAVWETTQIALVQAALNAGVQMLAHWIMVQSGMAAASTIAAGAATAAWATAAAAMKIVLIGLAKAAVGMVGLVVAGVSTVLNAVSTVIGFMLVTIGQMLIKLGTSLQSVPIIGNIIGGILIAAGAGSIALGAAMPGIVAALTATLGASVAALSAAIPAFEHGGIVTGPTLAMLGEAGPEAVVPLSRGGMGFGQQTIILEIDRRELTRMVLRGMPGEVRLKAGAIA